ncbi:MAG TPA: hypothetical protein DCS63_10695 [Elusimicrobia bacterium]|nr:hypothetical protein [Elusimicrobiota bacterium]
MTRSDPGTAFIHTLPGYLAVSLLSTAVLLVSALGLMKLAFVLGELVLAPERAYWPKPLPYDAIGFALASSGTALAQYYLVNLLLYPGVGRRMLAAAILSAAVLCGLFFWRAAQSSTLGAYAFSGLTVTLSALIGGGAGIFQKPGQNPRPFINSPYFR